MSYKIVAIDLDDTLLDAEKVCSERNARALKDAAAAGAHIVLTSGRALSSIAHYTKQLGLNDYTIAIAGAQVFDKDNNLIYSTALPSELAVKVMHWADDRNLHYQAYLADTGLTFPKRGKYARFYEEHCNITGTEKPDLKDMADIVTPKILIVDEADVIARHKAEIKPVFPELKFENSQPEYLEVLNPETSKGNALKWLAESLDIPRDEVMAIGDSELDVSMLKYAGMGVSVGNGSEIALKNADYITSDNDKDGVAEVIEKFVLS